MTMTTITCKSVPIHQRCDHAERLFGIHFPMQLEPYLFSVASELSPDYQGGYWEFYELGNGGFYMAPDADEPLAVSCPNGYEGVLSADAFGVAACLYAYSRLSFATDDDVGRVYAEQCHLLREYVMDHSEASGILSAID